MTRWTLARAAGIVLYLASLPSTASTVLVDRFGPGDSFDTTGGWSVGNTTFPPDFATAFAFSGGPAGGYLDQITIALWPLWPGNDAGGHYRATVYLDAPDPMDEVLIAPAAPLESIQFQAFYAPTAYTITLQTSGTTRLQPFTLYWLAVEPVNGSQAAWNWNDQGYVGIRSHYNLPPNYGAWTTYFNSRTPAFRITVNDATVPIPAAAWFLAAGLALLGGVKRLR